MKTNQQTYKARILSKSRLIALAAVILLGSIQIVRAQWNGPDGSGNISNANTGNVGINTPNPQGKLHITTNIGEKAMQLFSTGSSSYGRLTSEVTNWWGFTNNASYSGGLWYLDDTTKGGQAFALDSYAGGNQLWIGGFTAGANPASGRQWIGLWLDINNHRVGVGTTNPTAALHVAGDGKFTGNLTVDEIGRAHV